MTDESFMRSVPAAALRGLENGRLAGLGPGGVELLELLGREEHLAAHLDIGRDGVLLAGLEPVRDRADRADVGRDVLADAAVATRDAAGQHAVLVRQRDRQAIDLELAEELGVVDAFAQDARVPALELLDRERVVEAVEPLPVLVGLERRRDHAADLLRRRVGRAELGQLLLEALELADQLVVVVVGDDRCVVAVIALPMLLDRLGELLVPLPQVVIGRHAIDFIVAR